MFKSWFCYPNILGHCQSTFPAEHKIPLDIFTENKGDSI